MTEAQLFKHLGEQAGKQGAYFRRHFNALAIANLLTAIWTAAAGAYIWLVTAFPWRLMGLALFIVSGMALHLAHVTRRHGQRAFEEFMRLRTNNLEIAKMLEDQSD